MIDLWRWVFAGGVAFVLLVPWTVVVIRRRLRRRAWREPDRDAPGTPDAGDGVSAPAEVAGVLRRVEGLEKALENLRVEWEARQMKTIEKVRRRVSADAETRRAALMEEIDRKVGAFRDQVDLLSGDVAVINSRIARLEHRLQREEERQARESKELDGRIRREVETRRSEDLRILLEMKRVVDVFVVKEGADDE